MKRVLLLSLLLLWGPCAFAQNAPQRVGSIPGYLTPLGSGCQLTVTSGAAVLLSSCSGGIPTGSLVAYVTVETASIRWRDDGTAPTTTVGVLVTSGQQLVYSGFQGALQFIATSTTATLDVAFYK